MVKRRTYLANLSHHAQTNHKELFARYGFEVDPYPLLQHTQPGEDTLAAARAAVQEALLLKPDGVFVAGRTDLAVYASLLAAQSGLRVYVPTLRESPGRPLLGRFERDFVGLTELRLLARPDGSIQISA